MIIKPQRDLLLVEIKKQDKTDSGIIITSQDVILERATILDVGQDVKRYVKGQEVLFKSWAIDVIQIEDVDYIFLAEDKILAVIENEIAVISVDMPEITPGTISAEKIEAINM
jgi:co-chaperonin GroES (HSP10)